jgi:hypothetical protein
MKVEFQTDMSSTSHCNYICPDQGGAAQPAVLMPDDEVTKRPPNSFILFCRSLKPALVVDSEITELEANPLLGKMSQLADEQTYNFYSKQAKQLADLNHCLHPDYDDLRRKKQPPHSNIKVAEPIRIKVIVDATELDPMPTDDPIALLKII